MSARHRSSRRVRGSAAVELAIVGAVVLAAVLVPPPGLPARLMAALGILIDRLVVALEAPLP